MKIFCKSYKNYLTLIFSDSKIDRLRIRDKDVGNVSAVWLRNDDLKIFNNWAIDYVEVRQVEINNMFKIKITINH